jgi:Ca-activated chloride channel family protein
MAGPSHPTALGVSMRIPLMLTLCAAAAGSVAALPPHDQITADIVITGVVTDSFSRVPLPAQVLIANTSRVVIADRSGRYIITVPAALQGGKVQLVVQYLGYVSARQEVQLNGDTVRVDFKLAQAVIGLQAMTADFSGRGREGGRAAGAVLGYSSVGGDPHNTEGYDRINENQFRSALDEPLSTFSIDVDRASYSNVRRFLREGKLPPVDAVRIEEMINYFPYRAVQPRGDDPFGVMMEVARAPWQPRHLLARISLFAPQIDLAEMPAANLVFLIDVSGSMQPANKLPLLKQSLQLLIGELRPQDRIAMVVYAGSAGLVLESTPGSEKERIFDALEALRAGGSTAGGAGLRLAYDVARQHHIAGGNNRVILATDGDFNVGVSSDAEMVALIEEKRQQGTFLTVLGYGMGNIKDNKLEKLANHGNGNYAYIDDIAEARKVLVEEIGGTLLTVARDVKLQVEFNPQRVRAYRLIGYENRLLANQDFNNDTKDAGEIGAGHTVTALYEIVPVGVEGTVTLQRTDSLRYQQPRTQSSTQATDELAFVKLRFKRPDRSDSELRELPMRAQTGTPSSDFTFAASVASFGMLLRNSPNRGNATYESVISQASTTLADDRSGYRREFVRLVQAAQRLAPVAVPAR